MKQTLIIGGGMAYTFVKAQGYEVGKSLCDDSKLDYCKEMMAKAQEKGVKLLLPVDTACVESTASDKLFGRRFKFSFSHSSSLRR